MKIKWIIRKNIAIAWEWLLDLFTPEITDQEWELLDPNLQSLIQRDIVNSKEIARNIRRPRAA